MIKTKRYLFFILSLAVICVPYIVFGQWDISAPSGSNLPELTVGDVIKNITNWVLGFVAGIAVLMLIWGGIRYLTALGDESQVEEAKNIISQAVIGLTIVGIAYAVVVVVIDKWIGS